MEEKNSTNLQINMLKFLTNTANNFSEKFNSTEVIDVNQGHINFLSAKTLIAIIILLVHTIASPIFEKFQFHYVHESGISMFLGMIVGLVSKLVSPNVTLIILLFNL